MATIQYLVTLLAWIFADRDLRKSAQAAESAWQSFCELSGPEGFNRRCLYEDAISETYRDLAALQINPERRAKITEAREVWDFIMADPYTVEENIARNEVEGLTFDKPTPHSGETWNKQAKRPRATWKFTAEGI